MTVKDESAGHADKAPSPLERLLQLLRGIPLRVALVAVLMPLFVAATVFAWMLNAERINDLRRSMVRAASVAAVTIGQYMGEEVATLSGLASSTRIDAEDWGGFYLEAERLIHIRPHWLNIILATEKDQVFNFRLFGQVLPALRDPDSAAEVFRTQRPTLGNLRSGSSGLGSAIRVPVIRNGRVLYALGAPSTPEKYSAVLRALRLPLGWEAAVTDAENVVAGHTVSAPVGLAIGKRFDLVSELLTEGADQVHRVELPDGTEGLAVTRELAVPGWHVTVWAPSSLLAGPSQMLRYADWFMVAICVVMGLILLSTVLSTARGRRNLSLLIASRDRLQSSQTALRESEARLSGIVNSAMDAIITTDEDQRVLLFNAAAEHMFGYAAAEVIGKPMDIFIPERLRQTHRQHVEQFMRSGITSRQMGTPFAALSGVHRNGEEFPVEASISQTEVQGRRLMTVILRDITERVRTEGRMRLLAEEVDHRAKNILAVVLGMISLNRDTTVPEMVASLTGRVMALGRTHTLLAENRWTGADLRRIVEDELAPFRSDSTQIRIEGPPLSLRPAMAQSVAITLHELTTNATKYGALSGPGGSLYVGWTHDGHVTITWSEQSVKPVGRPQRQGMGLRVIAQTVRHQLGGSVDMDWRPEGLVCRTRFPLEKSGGNSY